MDISRWFQRQKLAARFLITENEQAVAAVAKELSREKSLTPIKARAIVKKYSNDVPDEIDFLNMRGGLWRPEAVSGVYKVSTATLRRWRKEKRGPRALRIGRYICYYAREAPPNSPAFYEVEEWEPHEL